MRRLSPPAYGWLPLIVSPHDALNQALQLYAAGQFDQAAVLARTVLGTLPDQPVARHTLGIALCASGKAEAGLDQIAMAIALDPGQPVYAVNRAVLLLGCGHRAEAVTAHRRALRLRPADARLLDGLGTTLGDLGRAEEALRPLRHRAALEPELAEVYRKLAIVEQRAGRLLQARQAYRRAWRLGGGDGLLVREALTLPIIPRSVEEIDESRRHCAGVIEEACAPGLRLDDPLREVGITSFYLSYHGLDNRPLNTRLADLYASACPSLLETAPHCREPAATAAGDGRLRIGFVSDYFHGHTIGMLNEGLIEQLSRRDFEVTLFLMAGPEDDLRRHLRAMADRVVDLPADLGAARHAIAEQRLDILYYTDIGMSPFTYFLAFARLAPVQCLTWGHPDTTGIPTLDLFLSCGAMEPEEGESQYSERLVRLPGPTIYYRRPSLPEPRRTRVDFGLPADRTLYLCPQSLFKIHPDYDEALIAILRRDPNGLLVFVDPRGQGGALLARMRPKGPDVAGRIRMLPGLKAMDFIALTADADVMLDPFHYSGGKTTLEALAFGTPVVTWPGAFMRGRHTLGFYRLMGFEDTIARDQTEYVELAVRLGTDSGLRALVRARILERCGVLFEDTGSVRAIEGVLSQAVRQRRQAPDIA
ncbi:tetratricopeptide repeat protein [Azospirillum sp. B510]|uniref:O-linked N-acetylglucosamine transferase, SPINDLY family protein n=1 Tax=Azospirillum sp. (strain B510) TaxID=137722 RepID=UPI00130545F8|nr:tetratricopeptide repeat protein [Azospirillum sp. B510]